MTDAEPLEGITDAISVACDFVMFARVHRERPWEARKATLDARDMLIAKLKKLGKQ